MSCESEAAVLIRSAGRRVTSARLAVIGALRHSGAHMTTAEVIGAARRQVPHIDASTVYRTLAELRDAHMAAETRLAYGESFYEWIAEKPHHHLRCASCGSLTGLDPALVSGLASGSLQHHGFKLNTDHLVFEGLCAQCRRQSSPRDRETRQP